MKIIYLNFYIFFLKLTWSSIRTVLLIGSINVFEIFQFIDFVDFQNLRFVKILLEKL